MGIPPPRFAGVMWGMINQWGKYIISYMSASNEAGLKGEIYGKRDIWGIQWIYNLVIKGLIIGLYLLSKFKAPKLISNTKAKTNVNKKMIKILKP